MINENSLLTKMGLATHKVDPTSIISNEWDREATCLGCGSQLTSMWLDDPDRLTGWSAWKSKSGSKCE